MGLIDLLTSWFEKKPEARPPPEYRPPSREEEEIAELLAIGIL